MVVAAQRPSRKTHRLPSRSQRRARGCVTTENVRRPVDPWNESSITAPEEARVRDRAQLLELPGQGDNGPRFVRPTLDALGAPGLLALYHCARSC